MEDNILASKSGLRQPSRLGLADCAILLDVDGTILDIASTPEYVTVPASLREVLAQLLAGTSNALALVSGRTIENLDHLFAPLRLPAIGAHGMEMRVSSADTPVHHADQLPQDFRTELGSIADLDTGIRIEDKGFSLAVHFRLAPRCERQILQRVDEIRTRFPAVESEVLRGKALVEVKPKRFSKGAAVLKLMEHAPFRGRRPIFFGDDTTDESVFAVLPTLGGVGYCVGTMAPGATASLASPAKVRAWLARFAAERSIEMP